MKGAYECPYDFDSYDIPNSMMNIRRNHKRIHKGRGRRRGQTVAAHSEEENDNEESEESEESEVEDSGDSEACDSEDSEESEVDSEL